MTTSRIARRQRFYLTIAYLGARLSLRAASADAGPAALVAASPSSAVDRVSGFGKPSPSPRPEWPQAGRSGRLPPWRAAGSAPCYWPAPPPAATAAFASIGLGQVGPIAVRHRKSTSLASSEHPSG